MLPLPPTVAVARQAHCSLMPAARAFRDRASEAAPPRLLVDWVVEIVQRK